MIQYVLDYLDTKGQYAYNQEEESRIEEGISLYLNENGIRIDEEREYFVKYVDAHLRLIEKDNLKLYFLEYPIISQVKQMAIEYRRGGMITKERVSELRELMSRLISSGLGSKYVPAVEINEILGRHV